MSADQLPDGIWLRNRNGYIADVVDAVGMISGGTLIGQIDYGDAPMLIGRNREGDEHRSTSKRELVKWMMETGGSIMDGRNV